MRYDGSEGVTESRSNSVKHFIFAEIVGEEIIITVAELREITVVFSMRKLTTFDADERGE